MNVQSKKKTPFPYIGAEPKVTFSSLNHNEMHRLHTRRQDLSSEQMKGIFSVLCRRTQGVFSTFG